MYLVVGLGNPGREYEGTRHNVGFMVIDVLSKMLGIEVSRLKFKSLMGEGHFKGEKLVLLKPQTFMNLSGEALYDAVNFYKLPLENVIVIYDDKDLDVGKIRIRRKGSSGGHNGMNSIIYLLGSEDFPRIRIGIGRPEQGDLVAHVLGKFNENEKKVIEEAVKKAAEAVIDIIENGIEHAMSRFNG
jgi:PTH1 family peptidyl-tRNA hydrolase